MFSGNGLLNWTVKWILEDEQLVWSHQHYFKNMFTPSPTAEPHPWGPDWWLLPPTNTKKCGWKAPLKNPQRLVQMVPYCLHSYKYIYILGLHTSSICGLLGQNPEDLKIIETRHQYFQSHVVAKKQPKSIPVTVWLVWGSSICMKRGHELCICHNVIGIWKLQVCHLQQKTYACNMTQHI